MYKTTAVVALAAALGLAAPAHAAGNSEGKIQVKLLATAVLPKGDLQKIKYASPGVVSTLNTLGVVDADTKADDNYVPTVAIEYFFTPNISVETICCVTQHDVDGAADLKGANGLVSNALIIPATFTLKYHLDAGPIKPYIGAGPSYFMIFSEGVGATAKALGATKNRVSDTAGVALQAGVDVPLNDKGLGFSIDAKRYFLGDVKAKWYDAAGTKVLETRHKLDPWVVSAGLSYRF
jgi:outer membrane protein